MNPVKINKKNQNKKIKDPALSWVKYKKQGVTIIIIYSQNLLY